MKDVIIIGAGPIGLACGIEAKKNSLDYLIFDKGCLVNSLYNYPMNMTFFQLLISWKSGKFLLYLTIQNPQEQNLLSITEGCQVTGNYLLNFMRK